MKQNRSISKTNQAIKDAFITLIIQTKDINKITVKALCDEANISKGTFYSHFHDVYEISEVIGNELLTFIEQSIDSIDPKNAFNFYEAFDKVFLFLKENEENYKNILACITPYKFISELVKILKDKLLPKIKFKDLSMNKNIRESQIIYLTTSTINFIIIYFRGELNITLDDVKNIIISFMKHFI